MMSRVAWTAPRQYEYSRSCAMASRRHAREQTGARLQFMTSDIARLSLAHSENCTLTPVCSSGFNRMLAALTLPILFTLRCTRSLLERLKADPAPPGSAEPTTVLGDWYVNAVNVGRLRLLMCTSERSLLTVILPARHLATFPERLRDAVSELLGTYGVAAPLIAREQFEMASHHFGRTRSRHVLGSMTDFAFLAEEYIRDEGPDVDLTAVALYLNRAPCKPIGRRPPEQFVTELFRDVG